MAERDPELPTNKPLSSRQDIHRLLSYFAHSHRPRVDQLIENLLARSPGSLTESNVILVAIAGNRWPTNLVERCLRAVPVIGNVVRVQQLDAPGSTEIGTSNLGLIRENFGSTIGNLDVNIQAQLVSSLIHLTTHGAIKYVPDAHQTVQSRAFLLWMKQRNNPFEVDLPATLVHAKPLSTQATSSKLVALASYGRLFAQAVVSNTNLESKDIESIIQTYPDLFDLAIKNPNAPADRVNKYLTADHHQWAARANASDFKLRQIVEQMFMEVQRGSYIAAFLKNPHISPDTLAFAEEQARDTPWGSDCLPVIYSHPNYPAEDATQRIWAYLDAPGEMRSYGFTATQFALLCSGHPELSPELQDALMEALPEFAWRYLALTDRVVRNIPATQIEEAVMTFDAIHIPLLERLSELDLLTNSHWHALLTGKPESASWAASHPRAPRSVEALNPALKLLQDQATLLNNHPQSRTDTPSLVAWNRLTNPDYRPFELPHAVEANLDREVDGIKFRAFRNLKEIEEIGKPHATTALSFTQPNNVIVEASWNNTVLAYGVIKRVNGRFEVYATWRNVVNRTTGKSVTTQEMPEVLGGAFKMLADTWNFEQTAFIESNTAQQSRGIE